MGAERLSPQNVEVRVEPSRLTYLGEPGWEEGVVKGVYPGIMVKVVLGEEVIWKKGIYSHRVGLMGARKEKHFDSRLERAVKKANKKADRIRNLHF